MFPISKRMLEIAGAFRHIVGLSTDKEVIFLLLPAPQKVFAFPTKGPPMNMNGAIYTEAWLQDMVLEDSRPQIDGEIF